MTENIRTPCPACGASSLIIGSDGTLTCGHLGCRDPLFADRALTTLQEMVNERRQAVRKIAALDGLLNYFCDEGMPVIPAPTARVGGR